MSFYISLLHWLPIQNQPPPPTGALLCGENHSTSGAFVDGAGSGAVTGRRTGLEHADLTMESQRIHEGLVGPQGFSGDPRAPGIAPGLLGVSSTHSPPMTHSTNTLSIPS